MVEAMSVSGTYLLLFTTARMRLVFYPLPKEASQENAVPTVLYIGQLRPIKGVHGGAHGSYEDPSGAKGGCALQGGRVFLFRWK